MVTGDQTGPLSGGEASETESANLIGGEGQIWSCDSSLNSSGAGLASSTLDTSSTVVSITPPLHMYVQHTCTYAAYAL